MLTLSQKLEAIYLVHGRSAPIIRRSTFFWGLLSWKSKEGWLWLENNPDSWTAFIASGQTTHHPLFGPCYAVSIKKEDSSLDMAFKSAVRMWPIRCDVEAREIFRWICKKIDQVYQQLP